MEDANDYDLKQFRNWYTQAGTPTVSVSETYDADKKCYVLELSQQTPATPEQQTKQPFHVPVRLALMNAA